MGNLEKKSNDLNEVKSSKKIYKKNEVNKTIKNIKIPMFLSNFLDFYKANLMKKHAIIYIITMIIFFIVISISTSNVDITNSLSNITEKTTNGNIFSIILKEKIALVFFIIFAGITPYVYIPILGVMNSYILANDIVKVFNNVNNSNNLIFMSIGSIIETFGIALAIATGIYYCSLSTKRFRYDNTKSFGLLDVEKAIYSITKNKKKIEENALKIEKTNIKKEKLNVKIPYKKIGISFLISSIIVVIGTLISII